MKYNKIRGIKLGPNLENYLKKVETQYILTTIISGFERKKWNYTKEAAKSVGLGVLTLGLYAPTPIKSNITLYTAIIDTKSMEVIYFSGKVALEKSPTDKKDIEKQYQKIITEYFGAALSTQ